MPEMENNQLKCGGYFNCMCPLVTITYRRTYDVRWM